MRDDGWGFRNAELPEESPKNQEWSLEWYADVGAGRRQRLKVVPSNVLALGHRQPFKFTYIKIKEVNLVATLVIFQVLMVVCG